MLATRKRVNWRDPDGPGLVDHEHSEEHPDGSEDGLGDQRTGVTAGHHDVAEHPGDGTEEQTLQCGVAQDDGLAVLFAAKRGDHDQGEPAERADQGERHREGRVAADDEVRHRSHQ